MVINSTNINKTNNHLSSLLNTKKTTTYDIGNSDPERHIITNMYLIKIINFSALIQLMAASVARRDVCYYTFDDDKLKDDIYNIHDYLTVMNRLGIGKYVQNSRSLIFVYWILENTMIVFHYNQIQNQSNESTSSYHTSL